MPYTVLQLLPVFSPHQAQWILLFPNNKDSVNLDIPNNTKDLEMSKPDDYEERHMPPRQAPKPPPKPRD
ncbi:hypothetical protein B9Q22_15715 [Enterobacter roggenkampii]|nr:hypothetical protein B9Q25_09310 [Enterobacter roggenkampii]PJD18247.1 hypothetical protein B9Q21_13325 [Enterobacter roggenkampii]PJD19806.1 hypothetical protein B9Q22_15715 [Enterobacter roggenkampii]